MSHGPAAARRHALTTIVRGHPNADDGWTVEVAIPTGDGSSAAIADEASAEEIRRRLENDGFDARTDRVDTVEVADYEGARWDTAYGSVTSTTGQLPMPRWSVSARVG